MTELVLLGGFALVIVAVLSHRFILPLFHKTPSGIHLGPYVRGKSRTVGTRFVGRGFAFPRAPGHVNALVLPTTPLKGKQVIRLLWAISGDGPFHAKDRPSEPGEIRLMIQRKGDDYSGRGKRAFYRLYAPGPQFLAVGASKEMVADLTDPAGWIGVHGDQPNAEQFADVLANTAAIHVCFGGGGGSAHGAFVSGSATFKLISLEVLP